MKLATNKNNFKSNIDNVQSQNFGIGDASVVIDILRNRLYKNKIQTLVQEYICNGRDAMREIDSQQDIDIIAPTRFSPTFKVRDYGPGITPDRMATVFVNYGASTKRTNNKQTGGFGIGAKSAWSYTDSFTIVTFVDGTKRTYVAHTGKNNNGSLDLISTESTNEVNGTEIQIAVNSNDIDKFQQAINRCVFFWQGGYNVKGMNNFTVHTKGEMFNKYLELCPNTRFLSNISEVYGNDLICAIDGISYKLTSFRDKIESLRKIEKIVNGKFVIHIPNGLVEVSANREEISDSEHTIKHLTRLLDKTLHEVETDIKSHFKGIKSPYEYLKAFSSYKGKFNLDTYRVFGDYYIERNDNISSALFEKVMFYKVFTNRKGKFVKHCVNSDTRRYDKETFDIRDGQKDRLFYNSGESAVKIGQRLRKYLETHDNAILIEDSGDTKVFNKLIKDLGFKDIASISLPAKVKKVKAKKTAKEFCLHTYSYYRKQTTYTTLDSNTDKWYYVELNGNSLPNDLYGARIRRLEEFFNINICALSQSSVKIVKGNKNFISLKDFIDSYEPDKKHLGYVIKQNAIHTDIYENIKGLKGIKDKAFSELIKLYDTIPNKTESYPRNLPSEIIDKIVKHDVVIAFKKLDKKQKDLSKAYPLLDELSYDFIKKNSKDVVTFINLQYKGGK